MADDPRETLVAAGYGETVEDWDCDDATMSLELACDEGEVRWEITPVYTTPEGWWSVLRSGAHLSGSAAADLDDLPRTMRALDAAAAAYVAVMEGRPAVADVLAELAELAATLEQMRNAAKHAGERMTAGGYDRIGAERGIEADVYAHAGRCCGRPRPGSASRSARPATARGWAMSETIQLRPMAEITPTLRGWNGNIAPAGMGVVVDGTMILPDTIEALRRPSRDRAQLSKPESIDKIRYWLATDFRAAEGYVEARVLGWYEGDRHRAVVVADGRMVTFDPHKLRLVDVAVGEHTLWLKDATSQAAIYRTDGTLAGIIMPLQFFSEDRPAAPFAAHGDAPARWPAVLCEQPETGELRTFRVTVKRYQEVTIAVSVPDDGAPVERWRLERAVEREAIEWGDGGWEALDCFTNVTATTDGVEIPPGDAPPADIILDRGVQP